jgi:AraC family transcriptional regulator of adaptative response / DNA-3-methyladenine glycosylase II
MPGDWDAFECAVRAIAGLPAAVRIAHDFGDSIPAGVEGLTHFFPLPATLASARLAGLSRARAEALRTLARATADGAIDFDGPVEALLAALSEIGGPRLAGTVAMYALGEPDALPAPSLAARAEAWRPWRSYGFIALTK